MVSYLTFLMQPGILVKNRFFMYKREQILQNLIKSAVVTLDVQFFFPPDFICNMGHVLELDDVGAVQENDGDGDGNESCLLPN
jgi:hypothetical protein